MELRRGRLVDVSDEVQRQKFRESGASLASLLVSLDLLRRRFLEPRFPPGRRLLSSRVWPSASTGAAGFGLPVLDVLKKTMVLRGGRSASERVPFGTVMDRGLPAQFALPAQLAAHRALLVGPAAWPSQPSPASFDPNKFSLRKKKL